MGIKSFKPTSAARRLTTVSDFAEITRDIPEKTLTTAMRRSGGRNSDGHITRRHQGGGHKRRYRIIDFKRLDKDGVPAKVVSIEYDPNRTANIALLHYADGEKRYILAPTGLQVNDQLHTGPTADIRPGNALPLQNIPVGTVIHNVEIKPGRGSQFIRSAGSWGQLMWLSNRDLCQAMERAVVVEDAGFLVLNLMSDNPGMRWEIDTTRHTIGYAPLDGMPADLTEVQWADERDAEDLWQGAVRVQECLARRRW